MYNLVLCQEFENNIQVFQDKDYSKYVYCLIRGYKISLNNEPEEFIRQCLLYYLVNLSNLYPNFIDIKVEFNNADIVIFPKLPSGFQPYLPLVVIETKTYVNVAINKKQLNGYLEQFRCNIGFLFDGNSLVYIQKDQIKSIGNLEDFRTIIEDSVKIISYQNEYQLFKQTQIGDLEAFREIAEKYQYADILFEYQASNGDLIKQRGKFFKFTEKHILFRMSGNYTKEKQKVNLSQFKRVLSLIE